LKEQISVKIMNNCWDSIIYLFRCSKNNQTVKSHISILVLEAASEFSVASF